MEKDLRLRLVVRRHGVPDVKLLWNATANEDLTISKLVAAVNDVVPLESGEWGLEDYALELKDASGDSFECVHYHLVSKVLKDDDQVLIRPLLTGDLKRRRLSGRHQISADGKHLVDGLAFGRSWLKPPRDRPAVALPPRKKARIAYDSEDDIEPSGEDREDPLMLEYDSNRAEEDPASVRLRARFYDAEEDGDDEDEEFEPAADGDDDEDMDADDDDLQEELRLIREDNATVREGDILEELRTIRDKHASNEDDRIDTSDNNIEDELQMLRQDNAIARGNDILEELRDIRNKRASNGKSDSNNSHQSRHYSPVPSASNALIRSTGKPSSGAQLDMDSLDKITALRAAFPSAPISGVEQALLRCDKDSERAYRRLKRRHRARIDITQMLELQSRSLSNSPLRQPYPTTPSEQVSNVEKVSPAAESDEISGTLNHSTETNVEVGKDLSSDSESESSDSDSDSSSESSAAASESQSERDADESSEDDSEDSSSDKDHSPSDDDSGDDDDESEDEGPLDCDNVPESADQNTSHPGRSSSEGSDSDSSSSDESSIVVKKASSKTKTVPRSESSDSSSESSSESEDDSSSDDSDSESEPEEIPTRTLSNQQKILQLDKTPSLSKAPAAVAPATQAPPVPPGQGLSKTQKRNARRKLAKRISSQALSASGLNSREPSQASAVGEQAATLAMKEALQARKTALLNAITSVAPDEPQSQASPPGGSASDPRSSAREETAEALQSPAAQEDASAQRRMKPNISAARRMLMGSLGLGNPKTKADEDKIRRDLMKGVRPHINARLTETTTQTGESTQSQESVEEDPEAWRDKIAYRAVECCHEGIELSEPPFPFVQRWDPQQHVEEWFGSKNKRGGKRKRVQRNQATIDEDGDSQSSKKRRLSGDGVAFSDAFEPLEEGDTTLNYDDPPEESSAPSVPPVSKATAEGSQITDFEDLPSLPSDLTTLPDLRPGQAKTGMVITWKQWVLSTATNWQPEVINFTGVLVRVFDEDATEFEFLLAHRDRNLDRTEKVYDENTGQRVYDRFEAPDDEDDADDDGVDDGYRKLQYTELIEPRIVQQPLEGMEEANSDQDSSGPLTDSVVHETVYDDQSQPSRVNGEQAGQSEADETRSQANADVQAKANTDGGQPRVVDKNDSQHDTASGDGQPDTHALPQDNDSVRDAAGEDESTPMHNINATVNNALPTTEETASSMMESSQDANALSISSDRRHEISLLIEEAGFRRDVSPSILRKTSSPSRQLLEMTEAASTSRISSKTPLSEMSVARDSTPVPPTSDAAVAPPSSASSIRSGRQPDLDFDFGMGGDDMPQMGETGDGSPVLGESTPKASEQTPTRPMEALADPGSNSSFPSLEELFQTATQNTQRSRSSQSPSKSQVMLGLESRKSIVKRDEDYEAAMRQIDGDKDEDDEEEDEAPQPFRGIRKQLFPNSSQPAPSRSPDLPDMKPVPQTAPSSFTESQDVKPFTRTRRRRSSPFSVPAGSQVIALSSSQPSSPTKDLGEIYADDDIDPDYDENSSSLPHGSGWVQKNKPPKAKTRAKSMPAAKTAAKTAAGRRPIPPSTQPVRSSAKIRKSVARF